VDALSITPARCTPSVRKARDSKLTSARYPTIIASTIAHMSTALGTGTLTET
jgi:hypothetical protein